MAYDIIYRYTCSACGKAEEVNTNLSGYASMPHGWRQVYWHTPTASLDKLYCSIECEYRDYQEMRDTLDH